MILIWREERIGKTMKKKIKSIILDILIILFSVFLLLMGICEFFCDNAILKEILMNILGASMLFCIDLFLFLFYFCNFEFYELRWKKKADKYYIRFNNYNELIENVVSKIENSYVKYNEKKDDDFMGCFFARSFREFISLSINTVTIVKFRELPKNYKKIFQDFQMKSYEKYGEGDGPKKISDFYDIKIIVVEKENKYFKNEINNVISQSFNKYANVCHVVLFASLESNFAYVLKPKDFTFILVYKKMKKFVLNLLSINKNDVIK